LLLETVASIVTGGGRVFLNAYTMSHLVTSVPYLAAFDEQTGARLWQRTRDASGLAYAQGSLFLMGEDSLWSLSAADGTTRFRVPVGVPALTMPPLDAPFVSDNAVFVARHGIHRFDISTGAKVFHTPGSGPAAAAVAAPGVVYFSPGNGAGHTALSATSGSVTFSTTFGGCFDERVHAVVLGSSHNAITSCYGLESVDLQARTRAWSISGYYAGVPAAANGVVYATSTQPHSVDARSESDGALLWTFKPLEQSTVMLHGRFIVTKNVLIFSSWPSDSPGDVNSVWIVDLASRKLIYRIQGTGNIALSSQGILYIATRDRRLMAYTLK
jgi:outer membrane protein assembly factor BamB